VQFSRYDTQGFCDEMFDGGGNPRPHARLLLETVESLSDGQLLRYKHAAERLLLQMGITFNVYGDSAGTERIFPFELIPRIVPAGEWDHIERGLKQRVHALNAFIDDIYHDQKILRGRHHSARGDSFGGVLPEAVSRFESALACVVPCSRNRLCRTGPICTPGRKCICQAAAGGATIRRKDWRSRPLTWP
jgi:hypothetical protein